MVNKKDIGLLLNYRVYLCRILSKRRNLLKSCGKIVKIYGSLKEYLID